MVVHLPSGSQFQEFGIVVPATVNEPYEPFDRWSMERHPNWRKEGKSRPPLVPVRGNPMGHSVYLQPFFQEEFSDREAHKSDWIPHHVKDPFGVLEQHPERFPEFHKDFLKEATNLGLKS